MYCPNCGYYNEDDAAFCGSCGMPLGQQVNAAPGSTDTVPQYEEMSGQMQEKPGAGDMPPSVPAKKKSRKIWIILAAILVIGAAAAAAFFLWILPGQEAKKYQTFLDEGNRYLNEMDYEKAEDAYLKAIAIDPKQKEPYVQLIDLYLISGERQKAKAIIEDAKGTLPEDEKGDIEKIEEERKGELDGEGTVYAWTVEPEIEADDIYYLKETDSKVYTYNEMERQMFTDYAVIKQGNTFGLIDMNGQILGGMDYEEITSGSGYYLLTREEEVYEPEYMTEMDSYYLYGDEILPAVAIEGDAYGFKGAFYYCGGLQNIFDAYGEAAFGPRTWTEPEDAIPVKSSDTMIQEAMEDSLISMDEWLAELPGGYGIYQAGGMTTDFIYDACGSLASGLLAVEQDGKWGYVDREGNVVIPVEYDASWTQYVPQNGSTAQDYCYAASEGYVVLVKDGVWEMRDSGGETVIDPGVFEEMRPVFDGKCWVKQDGRWGVIELLGEDPGQKTENETGLSASSSVEDIRDAVLAHLNAELGENGGSYSITDDETSVTDDEYRFLIRYAMPEEEAEKIIEAGGMPSANRHAGDVYVDRLTGIATFEPVAGEKEQWRLWESDGTEADNTENITPEIYRNAYEPLLDQVLEDYRDPLGEYLNYAVYDIDKDGVKELLLQIGTCEADYLYQIYTIKDGRSEYLGNISGFHTMFYADENGGSEDYIIQLQGHMGYETIYHVSIRDGAPYTEEISSRELAADDSYYSNPYPLQMTNVADKSLLDDIR